MPDTGKTGKSVADNMRDDLRISMHLGVTAYGAQCAEEERNYLEERIKEDLPKLTACDVFMVSIIVSALTDNRVL